MENSEGSAEFSVPAGGFDAALVTNPGFVTQGFQLLVDQFGVTGISFPEIHASRTLRSVGREEAFTVAAI